MRGDHPPCTIHCLSAPALVSRACVWGARGSFAVLTHQGLLCRWLSGSAVHLERCMRHLHSGASWEVGRVRNSSASRERWSSYSTAPGHPHGACSCPGFLLPSEFQKPGPRPSSPLPRPHPLRPGRRPVADRYSAPVTVRPQEGPLCQCRPGAGEGPEYVRLPGGVHPLVPARPPQELRQYLSNLADQCASENNAVDMPLVIILDNLHHVSSLGEIFNGLLNCKDHKW